MFGPEAILSRMSRHALFVLLIVSATTAHADPTDDFITAQMRSQNIPGLSLAILKDGKIVKAQGYGFADAARKIAATPDTVYHIGSVSKPLVATAVMRLVQDGLLSLDDPIGKHLFDLPAAWGPITIRQLLTHTAGLVRDAPAFDPYKNQPDAEVLTSAYRAPLRYAPGEKWEYSNAGYSPLGLIVAKISGQPLIEFMAQKIFRQAGMSLTYPTNTKEPVPNRARGYADNDRPLKEAREWRAFIPSGGFLSTVIDLAKWDIFLDGFLSAASRSAMWTPVTLTNGTTHPYGLGWELESPVKGRRVARHGGSVVGFRAEFARFVDDRTTIILLMNLHDVDWQAIVRGVAALNLPSAVASR
jgi:CubicO group peptidase (beta-lactamase class C family)